MTFYQGLHCVGNTLCFPGQHHILPAVDAAQRRCYCRRLGCL